MVKAQYVNVRNTHTRTSLTPQKDGLSFDRLGLTDYVTVVFSNFQGGQRHHGRSGAPQEENGGGGARGSKPALATLLWSMRYADDARVASQSPEKLRNIMGVIVVVCAAFGLTVSDTEIEIMCLRTKGMAEAISVFRVEVAD